MPRYKVYLFTVNRTELVDAPDEQAALVKAARTPAIKLLREQAKVLGLKLKTEVEEVTDARTEFEG